MDVKKQLGKEVYEKAYLHGNFKLRSGRISNGYFDKYLFEADPILLSKIAMLMQELIPDGTEVLAGLELGGIPVVTALSIKCGIPAVFVRKRAKEYGTCKLAEGVKIQGKRITIIEDVVTTGGQIIQSVKELRERGAIVENVLCVILREQEGEDNLRKEGLTLFPLFTMEELNN